MDKIILCGQIADLLNRRNRLENQYTAENVELEFESYVTIVLDGRLIACAETEKVQWYQWEIKHVSVTESEEGKGYASKILKLAEEKAIKNGAPLLQCTIRVDNENSIRLFESNEYKRINTFFNVLSKRWLYIYQKIVPSQT